MKGESTKLGRMTHRLILLLYIFFTTALFSPGLAEEADFLIVENPAYLLVYNKYQQRLTFQESTRLLPYQPLRILEEDALLSDGYTPAMRVISGGETYFVIKDQEGNLANETEIGYHRVFENCAVLKDTVEILADGVVFLAKIPTYNATPQSKKFFLEKGDRVLRLFSKGGFVYVRKLGLATDFGWSNLTAGRQNTWWRIITKTTRRDTAIPPEISRRIEEKIREVNNTLEQLFDFFNRQTAQQKAVPQWEIEFNDTKITCALSNPAYREDFPESIRLLRNNLENMLLGTPYGVFYQEGQIEVRRK
jgi:hypothetical protein